MNRKSIITGLTTIIGFLLGLHFNKIFMYTMIGLASGYLLVFWLPYFIKWSQKQQRKR